MGPLAWASAALWWLGAARVVLPDSVIIELQPHDQAAAEAIAASCNAALGGSQCRSESGGPTKDAATNAMQGSESRVHVRVQLSGSPVQRANLEFFLDAGIHETRELELGANDPLPERHRAIGLVIAARVLERADELARAQEAQAEREQAERSRAERERTAEQAREQEREQAREQARSEQAQRDAMQDALSVRLDVGGLVGPGLSNGPVRIGGIARASLQLSESLPIAVLLALRVAARAGEPNVMWTTPSLGLLGKIALGRTGAALELRVEALAQRIDARAEDPTSGESERGHATRYGGALGLDLIFELARHFALFVGGETSLLWPRFVLEVQGRQAGAEGSSHVHALAGGRLML